MFPLAHLLGGARSCCWCSKLVLKVLNGTSPQLYSNYRLQHEASPKRACDVEVVSSRLSCTLVGDSVMCVPDDRQLQLGSGRTATLPADVGAILSGSERNRVRNGRNSWSRMAVSLANCSCPTGTSLMQRIGLHCLQRQRSCMS